MATPCFLGFSLDKHAAGVANIGCKTIRDNTSTTAIVSGRERSKVLQHPNASLFCVKCGARATGRASVTLGKTVLFPVPSPVTEVPSGQILQVVGTTREYANQTNSLSPTNVRGKRCREHLKEGGMHRWTNLRCC